MTTSYPRTSRLRPWLVAGTMTATVLVPAGSAWAIWHPSSRTMIEFRNVCLDGIRFGGAVPVGFGPANKPFKDRAIVVQPPPSTWREWKNREGEVMNTSIAIPKHQTQVDIVEEGKVVWVPVSHEGGFTKRYRNGPLQLGLVALNLENGNPDSELNTHNVTDCFLYAPIDVEPGTSANKVPIGKGDVTVAALATNLMPAEGLTPSNFRFGPGMAQARSSQLQDVNGDNRKDLVLRFRSTDAGLTCSTKTVSLVGKTASNGVYEGTGTVKPKNC